MTQPDQPDQPDLGPIQPAAPPVPPAPPETAAPPALPAPPSFEAEPLATAAPEAWDLPEPTPSPAPLRGDQPWGMVDPGPIDDGTWQSEGFASSSRRAWFLRIALVAEIGINLGAILFERGLELAVANGLRLSTSAGAALRAYVAILPPAISIIAATTLLATFIWLSRAVDNVPPLTGRTPLRSPREAIGWWFVPVASWWMPYTIVRDLAWRLRTTASDGTVRLVLLWWCFHAGAIIADVLFAIATRGVGGEQVVLIAQLVLAGKAIGDVLLLLIVASIARSERLQADRVGLPQHGPRRWPQFVAGWGPDVDDDEEMVADETDDWAGEAGGVDPLAQQSGERRDDYENRLLAELEGEATHR